MYMYISICNNPFTYIKIDLSFGKAIEIISQAFFVFATQPKNRTP